MLRILKALTIYLALNTTDAQADIIGMRPGSQLDSHGCVLDGGYSWCETSQQCERPWESPCLNEETDYCPTSNIQTCRMACEDPVCSNNQCAMRIGNCCDFTCSDIIEDVKCPNECPPPAPCPMPYLEANCLIVNPVTDHCGCTTGCPTVDCSHQPKISIGGTCGGYMPYGMAGVCEDGLECVYTMGPMIADAPGTCQTICQTARDNQGNCMDVNTPQIPKNCVTWYDGCNTCSIDHGEIQGCTMMYCFTQAEPYCQVFTSGDLHIDDICYRFCEDGSQNTINRQGDCPIGTECGTTSTSMVSFDSCGSRAHTCNLINGH